ncbi:sodium:solute symporter [Candidatus Fermentibacteria bacterium]|nr:sodium:solute symporter [Candidatus Fermentibacteria bacterium]
MPASYIAIGLYTAVIVLIGIRGMRRTKSFDDFLLGGGRVGPWMTALSYGTAYFSAVLFIGFAGKIGWGFGLSSIWIALGNSILGVLGVWLLLGNRIKETTRALGVKTMPEFLEARYGSPFFKGYASLAIFVFMIPYTAAVFIGLSYLFEASFHLPYSYILLFMGVFTGVYMVMGGYRSMAMMDVVFGLIMTAGVAVLLWFSMRAGGGLAGIASRLRAVEPALAEPIGPPGALPLFSLVFLTSIAPFAMPQLLIKFYAVKDRQSVRIGTIASTVFALLITGTAYFTGSLTRIFLTPETAPAAFDSAGKPVFDALMPELLSRVVPSGLIVILLLLILAASMSTLASLVLISSASVTKDFYHGFIRKNASDRALTTLGRVTSAFFIVLSMILAWQKPAVIVTLLSISWGAIASVFLGPFIWGILGRRIGRSEALASSMLGLAVCLYLFFAWGAARAPQAASAGMIVSLVLPAAGLLGRRKSA